MEAIRIEEIELFGEEGGRVLVSADLWAGDPDKAGIALKLIDGDGRAMIRLDHEETNQLRGMIEAQVPERRFGEKGITFGGPDGGVLDIRPSNMGDPYREGFDISYGIDRGHYVEPMARVFVQDREMTDLLAAIDRFAPHVAGAAPKM